MMKACSDEHHGTGMAMMTPWYRHGYDGGMAMMEAWL